MDMILGEYIFDEEKYGGKGLEQLISLYEYYHYDLYDQPKSDLEKIATSLENIRSSYPKFITVYQELWGLYAEMGDTEKEELIFQEGYKLAQELVIKKGKFPVALGWAFQENRSIIRFLFNGACREWEQGNLDKTGQLYTGLLSSNLYDQIGTRYDLLALIEGLTYEEHITRFGEEEISEEQMNWFNENAPLHEVFDDFFKMLEEMNEE